MKRLFALLISVFLYLNVFAQMDISWSSRFHQIKDECVDAKIIAEDINGYYYYYCNNEYVGQGDFEYKYYVVRTDKNGNEEKTVKIDFGSKKFKIENTWRSGDLIGFILSKTTTDKPDQSRASSRKKTTSSQSGKQDLYVEYLHLKDMRLIDKPQKFISYNYIADSAQKPYLFNFSENKTKMVFCLLGSDTTGKTADVRIYDNRMNLLWDKQYQLKNIQMESFKVADVAVSNDGARALLAINGYATGKKVNHAEDKAFLIHMEKYVNKGHIIHMEKAWATDMKCCFNMEGDYIIAGYYGIKNDKPYLAAGSFAYTFDKRQHYQKNSSMQEFKEYETDDMVAPFKPNPKDRNAVRPVKGKKDMIIPSQFTTYVDYLVPMIGGNVIMVGEQRYSSHIIPPKRKGDKPTGEEAQYFRDIAITNIDKTGLITGNAYIAKRQKDNQGNNEYNGYQITRDRYGMYIMFNDHVSNFDKGKYTPERQYNSDKLKTQVNFIQIYSDGSYNWQQAFDTRNLKMPFYKTLYLTTDKHIIFMCHWNDDNIIGKFQTR